MHDQQNPLTTSNYKLYEPKPSYNIQHAKIPWREGKREKQRERERDIDRDREKNKREIERRLIKVFFKYYFWEIRSGTPAWNINKIRD